MDRTYWHKQEEDKALYPDLMWSRPQNKLTAGKILIIGGNIHGFSSVGQAYQVAQNSAVGTIRVLLPDALQKTVSNLLPEAIFCPSTPSGSFSQKGLTEALEQSNWADGVLLAGDLGRNSEPAVFLEKYIGKSSAQLTLTKDSVDYFTRSPQTLLNRFKCCLVLSLAQLQQLTMAIKFVEPIKFSMSLLQLVDSLHTLTETYRLNIVVKHLGTIFVATNGLVGTLKTTQSEEIWRVPTAAAIAVWWLQNPTKTFEAFMTALIKPAT
jgi:hypothetical protein